MEIMEQLIFLNELNRLLFLFLLQEIDSGKYNKSYIQKGIAFVFVIIFRKLQ